MIIRALSTALLCLLAAGAVHAEPPVLSDVTFAQRTDGSMLVDIHYNVQDADSDTLAVTLLASEDGGATWDFPCRTLLGDVGDAVLPGAEKQIVWDFGADNPGWSGDTYQVKVKVSDAGVLFPAQSPGHMAITDWSSIDWTDEAEVEKRSRADVLHIAGVYLWDQAENNEARPVERLKELNPDIMITGYMNTKNVFLAAEHATTIPFYTALFERTRPYWSYTTEGDTLMDWVGKVVVNILDPECRAVMVSTFAEFNRESNNQVDGVFWDYFAPSLWIGPGVEIIGEPDLDQDGIPHDEDYDERVAFRAAQVSMVETMRDTMGGDFAQIFNGNRAYTDTTFCALADGIYFEIFPTLSFPDPGLTSALDPGYEHNLWRIHSRLRTEAGGPYQTFSNAWRSYYVDHHGHLTELITGDQLRAVALLVDGYASWNSHSNTTFNYTYGWPANDISLGEPLGPTIIDGSSYSRDFRYGRIEVEITSGMYPDPLDYWIYVNGNIVEVLAIPYHYP